MKIDRIEKALIGEDMKSGWVADVNSMTENPEEIKTLLETGFEYVCQKDNKVFLRKRK